MPYREYKGNIFAADAQTLVNTVNCVGVMGKGVALEFRRRFPRAFEDYKRKCDAKLLRPGQILPYRKERPWILHFAVKDDWRHPSRLEWVESCLTKFVENYRRLEISSVAMPWIGAMNGGLPWKEVHSLIRSYLRNLADIRVDVIEFDPTAPDPLFDHLKEVIQTTDIDEFSRQARISTSAVVRIKRAVVTMRARSMSEVAERGELGTKSTDQLYAALEHWRKQLEWRAQQPLFES